MAELLMECEEEELEPWQKRIKEVEDDDDDDDDEPIFVREISGSKPANKRTVASFQPSSNHYKTPSSANPGTMPVTPVYQPISRPAASSAVVQPLPRPIGSPEPIKRPLAGSLPAHQPPRTIPAILQSACRALTIPSNSQPVCRNITFPAMAQPALRPVATITAQPVILNQGYIVNSSQVSTNNSQSVMFALRPNTALTQYPGLQALTATGSATQLVRPVQPLTQIRPISTPARTAPAIVHRPTPQVPSVTKKHINILPALQQPLLLNSQKTQQAIHTQSTAASIGRNENVLLEKRPAPPEIPTVSPKKPKTSENCAKSSSTTALSHVKAKPTTPSQNTSRKANIVSSPVTTQVKNGAPFPRACPKCNIHFNLLEPMRRHMKYCCPDKVHNFFLGTTITENSSTQGPMEEIEKGKLIMLVSDFYYGRHEGDLQRAKKEQKTHTTFRCFSCQKVLKNNIRFMNHMKHHLELEKQSTESWENHTTCHHCYRQFPTPFQLQCHIESSHTLYETTTICKICELSFESEQVLLQHMKDNHKPGEMPYVCQVCSYRSSTFVEVDNHFRNSHENTKCLMCPFCLKVIKCGTPYMHHYMKHQKKGVYRCTKCRLQFLTCKEKMDHKVQHHRTFRKPKQLEGLPPGTKVTIRASVGSINTVPSPTSSVCTSPTTTLPPTPKGKNANTKSNQSSAAKSNANHSKPKPTAPPKKKKKKKPVAANTTKRVKMVNTALRNLRCSSGVHKCIECKLEIKDFEGHFHTYMHCSKCKFSTSCNKAYMNHMVRFHGRNSNKKSSASKKTSIDKRRVTLVCLNCDFLTDVSGLDDMAKHLSESHTHSCQVVLENIPIFSSTLEGDMSKSRNKSPVGARAVYDKKNLKDAKVEGVTKKSIKKKKLPVRKKASNTSRNNKLKQVGTNKFLRKKHITSVEKVNDSDKPALDSCSTNSDVEKAESLDTDNKNDFDNVQDKPEQLSCRDTDPELGQSSDTKAFVDNAGASKATLSNMAVKMEDHNDLNLPGEEDVSFEQFLRKRDEPESMSSDISEQGSVHLEPLTPSEVLEHEATEILQKGNVTSCSNKGQTSEQADDTKESSTVTSTMVKSEEDNEDC
ncbi:zinc finger protein 280D isoform X4 [Ascaphus truei]|uniref:zinc finger protein 280D isoform X4 n=1 Tax=Ascaphus truei TaxID=8439 RepID=UPI003F59D618